MNYIKQIELRNYKAIRSTVFDLTPLTVLSGLNDTGKSSMWEPLLLLRQSERLNSKSLVLNGLELEAGFVRDVLCDEAEEKETIDIGILGENFNYQWKFDAWNGSLSIVPPVKVGLNDKAHFNWAVLKLPRPKNRIEVQSSHLTGVSPGSIVIMEQPEYGLHGSLAFQVGREAASAVAHQDMQIILETHSDSVFNGIRCAVHEGSIDPDLVSFLHFRRIRSGKSTGVGVENLKIDRQGSINKWPENFFNRWERE